MSYEIFASIMEFGVNPSDSRELGKTPVMLPNVSAIRSLNLMPEAEEVIYAMGRDSMGTNGVPPGPLFDAVFEAVHVAEIDHFVDKVIEQSRATSLVAPPGLGKSTRLPGRLLKYWGSSCAIVLMEPSIALASHHYDNLCGLGTPAILDDGKMDMSKLVEKKAVFITTPGQILARMARKAPMPKDSIVQHDEDHENDYSTVVFKTLYPKFQWVTRYITTTATSVAGDALNGERARGAPGLDVVSMEMPDLDRVTLDQEIDGQPAPWALKTIYGKKSLVFIEHEERAAAYAAVAAKYMPTMHITGNSDTGQVTKAVAMTKRDNAEGCLIVADSNYQSGYNFVVDHVVDFGLRKSTFTDPGGRQIRETYRFVTADEARQRAERAGRKRNGRAFCESRRTRGVSRLASGEIEHAIILFWLLGFQPPGYISEVSTLQFEDVIGYDLTKFFAAKQPWYAWRTRNNREQDYVPHIPIGGQIEAEDARVREKRRERFDRDVEREKNREAAYDRGQALLAWLAEGGERSEKHIRGAETLELGEYLQDSSGEAFLDEATLEHLVRAHGGAIQWLRYLNEERNVIRMGDLPREERTVVLLAWLTVWNGNSANFNALAAVFAKYKDEITRAELSEYGEEYKISLAKKAREMAEIHAVLQRWYGMVTDRGKLQVHSTGAMTALEEASYKAILPVGSLVVMRRDHSQFAPSYKTDMLGRMIGTSGRYTRATGGERVNRLVAPLAALMISSRDRGGGNTQQVVGAHRRIT